MSRQIIVGNWKMNGTSRDSRELTQALVQKVLPHGPDVVVCPPFTQLALLTELLASSSISLGAQDCHKDSSGAHTGDISPSMLTELGVSYVILGHSERRQEHGELDETVREKAVAAKAAGLSPIVCVGETEDQRESGDHFDTLGWQIKGSLPDGFDGILAYEPIWAIGTGRAATTEEISETMLFLRQELVRQFGEGGKTIKILYGGSVNDRNAASILSLPDVAGALVGGASLKAEAFLSIISAASAA